MFSGTEVVRGLQQRKRRWQPATRREEDHGTEGDSQQRHRHQRRRHRSASLPNRVAIALVQGVLPGAGPLGGRDRQPHLDPEVSWLTELLTDASNFFTKTQRHGRIGEELRLNLQRELSCTAFRWSGRRVSTKAAVRFCSTHDRGWTTVSATVIEDEKTAHVFLCLSAEQQTLLSQIIFMDKDKTTAACFSTNVGIWTVCGINLKARALKNHVAHIRP